MTESMIPVLDGNELERVITNIVTESLFSHRQVAVAVQRAVLEKLQEPPPVTWVDGGLIKDGLKDGTSLWYFSNPDALLSEYPGAQPMALYTSPLIKREPAPAPAPQTVRKVFVCASCEGVYMDEPVSECDCMPEKNEFIESTLSYDLPV